MERCLLTENHPSFVPNSFSNHVVLGLIGFDDFNSIMTEKILDRDPIEEIKKAFKLFDNDNTGKV